MTRMYDTIIIGAGMSGLAAGIRLAHYDKRVCILERHSVVGGLNSFYRRRGRHLDVGLHAITNYAAKGSRLGPLTRLLRQLRMAWEDLSLSQQIGSAVAFPGVSLRFNNDFEYLASEVRRHFPDEKDNFRRLSNEICDYDQIGQPHTRRSARDFVAERIRDPLLANMLLCPILFYGGSRQHDLEFGEFSVLFRSIFKEGFARPLAGVRLILDRMLEKFKTLGGELRVKSGVRRIAVKNDVVQKVVLDDGTELEAKNVLSSAGWKETMRMCDETPEETLAPDLGRLTFVEAISFLDKTPISLGHDRTIVFFNDSERFHYEIPRDLVDLRSATICSPNNFVYPEPLKDNLIRITALANFDRWAELSEEEYALAKLRWYDRMTAAAARFIPDFRGSVVDTDMFTPLTIRRYTGHERGSVYGSTEKRYDGSTPMKNLFICGNDQGLVGIVGTILSGISVANQHLLSKA